MCVIIIYYYCTHLQLIFHNSPLLFGDLDLAACVRAIPNDANLFKSSRHKAMSLYYIIITYRIRRSACEKSSNLNGLTNTIFYTHSSFTWFVAGDAAVQYIGAPQTTRFTRDAIQKWDMCDECDTCNFQKSTECRFVSVDLKSLESHVSPSSHVTSRHFYCISRVNRAVCGLRRALSYENNIIIARFLILRDYDIN